MYMQAKGNQSEIFRKIHTFRFSPLGTNFENRKVSQEEKQNILNREVKQVIYLDDFSAGVITTYGGSEKNEYLLCGIAYEKGKWVNAGEQPAKTLEDAKSFFKEKLGPSLSAFAKYYSRISAISNDTAAFIGYLQKHSQTPEIFLLNALKQHKIVLYGEHHFYEPSWKLMKRLIQMPEFAKTTGTIFLEMKQGGQKRMDGFMGKKTLDKQLLLDILGGDYQYGWNDKGMYEFLITLWRVNHELPDDKKIRVIFPDYGVSWLDIKTEEDLKHWNQYSFLDRDLNMAGEVEKTLKGSNDSRNSLFIVGRNHACKHANNVKSVGNILKNRFSDEEVFSIILHNAWTDNYGNTYGKVRNGLFDYVFQLNGNRPVALSLQDSPFGEEPCDFELEYQGIPIDGTYRENFDGYIFLQPLKEDNVGYFLIEEMYTDNFIDEIKRRCRLTGDEYPYRGIHLDDFTKEWRINQLKSSENMKRYPMF